MMKRFSALLICAAMLLSLPADVENRRKSLLLDAAVVSAAACAYVLVIPDVRQRIFREASIRKIWENFKHPFRSAREGGRLDHNGFWINAVGHPVSFMALGLYLEDRGYGNLETLAFTQAVNIAWEYVIEGSLWLPSSKDLFSDLLGSLAAVYVLAPLSDLGERRLNSGDRRWGNYFLYYLNPLKRINRLLFPGRHHSAGLHIFPTRGGFMLGWRWMG
jgi:hypothetical protein